MLDRLSQLLPGWNPSNEADLGVALAELIAYVGDNLSYQQDAIATEAYIETARSRVSLRRHALLVDYHVHDGCNARAWIEVQVAGNPGDQIFLNHALTRFYAYAPGMPASLAVGSGNEEAALLAGVKVFEPMQDAVLYPEHNQMSFYTWGDTNCCLPQGATEATLLGSYPNLQPADVLIFQEVKGPQTGNPADADIRRRCAVRLTQVATVSANGNPLVDPLYLDKNGKPIAVTEIQWSQEDALPFPVCISSQYLDSNGRPQPVTDASVVYGNVVLADQGLSFTGIRLGEPVPAPRLFYPANLSANRCQPAAPTPVPVRYRPTVPGHRPRHSTHSGCAAAAGRRSGHPGNRHAGWSGVRQSHRFQRLHLPDGPGGESICMAAILRCADKCQLRQPGEFRSHGRIQSTRRRAGRSESSRAREVRRPFFECV